MLEHRIDFEQLLIRALGRIERLSGTQRLEQRPGIDDPGNRAQQRQNGQYPPIAGTEHPRPNEGTRDCDRQIVSAEAQQHVPSDVSLLHGSGQLYTRRLGHSTVQRSTVIAPPSAGRSTDKVSSSTPRSASAATTPGAWWTLLEIAICPASALPCSLAARLTALPK